MNDARPHYAFRSQMYERDNQSSVICDASTGEVVTVTHVVRSPDIILQRFPDAVLISRVDMDRIVFFDYGHRGPTPAEFERAVNKLSDGDYGRVLDAKCDFDLRTRPIFGGQTPRELPGLPQP